MYTPVEGCSPYNGLYRKTRPKSGTFFRLEVYKREGISQVQVNERLGNLSFSSLKGSLIKTFRTGGPYGCNIWIIKALRENDKKITFFGDIFIIHAGYESIGKGYLFSVKGLRKGHLFSIKVLRKGHLFRLNGIQKGKGVDLGAVSPLIKLC